MARRQLGSGGGSAVEKHLADGVRAADMHPCFARWITSGEFDVDIHASACAGNLQTHGAEPSGSATHADLLGAYPGLVDEDIHAAIAYAADTLAHEETILLDTPAEAGRTYTGIQSSRICDPEHMWPLSRLIEGL